MGWSVHGRSDLVLLLVLLASFYVNSPLAAAASSATAGSSLPLAAEQTRRKDPLDGLRYYAGGWNISDRHYMASVGFSAAPVFAAAAVWFAAFAVAALVACCRRCCRGGSDYSYSRPVFVASLVLLLVFTAAAIIGCAVLYDGQGKFHGSTTATLGYVVSQSNGAVASLREFTSFLEAAKAAGVDRVAELPPDLKGKIDEVVARVDASADELAARTSSNSRKISTALETTRKVLIGVAAVTLILAFLGLVFSLSGLDSLAVVFWMDPSYCNIYIVRYFPSLAQRGRRHLHGHGRMGAPAAGLPHRPGRHPPLRRRGGDLRRPAPEQGGEPPARRRAQRRHLQRLQRQQRPSPGRAPGLLQPVRPPSAPSLQPLPPRPHPPPLRRRRGRRRQRATGVAGLRVPRDDDCVGVGGVRDGWPPHAGDVRAGAHRRQRQRRAEPARAGRRRPGGLHVRAQGVPVRLGEQLPRAAAAQRQRVPGLARRVGRGHGGRGGVGRALPGAEEAAGDEEVPRVTLQVPHRGEVAAQEPQEAVQASRRWQWQLHQVERGVCVVVALLG